MKPLDTKTRRRLTLLPAPETLETRRVMSAGAGNTIAIMPGAIAEANKPTTVEFTVAPGSFTSARGSVLLGIDAVAASNSAAKPIVASVTEHSGTKVQSNTYATAKPVVVGGQPVTPAVVAKINLARAGKGKTAAPRNFHVQVKGDNQTTGQFLTGFYLVGDADGNGKVDRADLATIKQVLGVKADSQSYKFDADANRDGRITRTDLQLAQQNLGAKTTIMPLISADIDATTADATTRTSTNPQVSLQGVASAGATIAYAAVGGSSSPISTTVDGTGNYRITVPLVQGANTFMVTSTDSFGQTISGTIAAITYRPVSTT
jgi:hypothetical protein